MVTPGGQLLISTSGGGGLYKLGTCGLERMNIDFNNSGPHTSCGPHPDGALFCGGKNCFLFNEYTDEFRTFFKTILNFLMTLSFATQSIVKIVLKTLLSHMQYQWDYHIGGRLAYSKNAVIIGGASVDTSGGRIEMFYEDGKWHRVVESDPTDLNPDLVKLPVEYKWFTVTKRPHCFRPWYGTPEVCDKGIMLFGGYGCESEGENCDFDQDSYVTYFGWDHQLDEYRAYTERNTDIDRLIPWEMSNVHGHRTIDSVMDRDSGYLVHAQVFDCKGSGLIYQCV